VPVSEQVGFNVDVDQEICLGSGLCTTYAPGTFDQDDETAKVFVLTVGADPLEAVQAAAEACPMSAITITIK
jgi:ferredoxin